MLNRVILAGALLLGVCDVCQADETTAGQPACLEREDLQEFVLAMLKKDMTWMRALKNCTALKGGLKMETIEDLPSDSDLGHVARVRVFGGGTSFVAYTLKITP